MRDIEKLSMEEPLIFQVWEAFPVEKKQLGKNVKIRWFKDHWEINSDWEGRCSDKEFISVLKIETIRLMLRHPFGERSKNDPNAWLASNAVLCDNYNCEKCKYKKNGCEKDCPYTYITPTPDEMDWSSENGFESGLPFEQYISNLVEHKSSKRKVLEKISNILDILSPDGESGEKGEGDGEWEAPQSEEEIEREEQFTGIADCAEDNSEGWGSSEESDLIEYKIKDFIKRRGGDFNSWGTIPAGLIEEIKREEVVKQDLSHFIKGVNGKIAIGWKSTRLRLNRRVEEFYGRKRFLGAKILIGLDTSGSMSDDDLKKTFTVIESLKYKAEIWICYCDTEVSKPEKLKTDTKKLRVIGRGGTDLNPVLEYSNDFDFTIIITDGGMSELQTTLRQEKTTGILFHDEMTYEELKNMSMWNKFMLGFVKSGGSKKQRSTWR
jgi:hypothetical protein